MADLRIQFKGLCGYLKRKGKDEMIVLLVENSMHPHDPMIIVDLGSLTPPADYDLFNIIDSKGWIDLNGCDVHVKPGGNPSVGKLKLFKPGPLKKNCPKADKEELAWFPDLNTLSGGGNSRTDLSAATLPPDVHGRVFLTEGELRCGSHASEDKQVLKLKFGVNPEGAIADLGTCVVSMKSTFVEFDVQKPPDTPWKTFRVNAPSTVVVQHMPRDSKGTIDHHWRAFDKLLASGSTPTLTEVGYCPSAELRLDSIPRKPCPQAILHEP